MKLLYIVVLVVLLEYTEPTCYNGSIAACNTCNGDCSSGQCFCSDQYTPCVPTAGECELGTNDCCPSGYFYDSNATCCTDTIICNPACYSDEYCKAGACSCNNTFYKGQTIQDLKPSLQCFLDVMIISISSCLLNYLKYDDSSMQFVDNSTDCLPFTYANENDITKTDNFQLLVQPGYCGTTMTNDSKKLYFSNTVTINPMSSDLIIMNPLSFNFTCSYNLTMQLSLNFSLHPVVGTVTLPGINGTGAIDVTMAAFWDAAYVQPITQDQTVPVGSDFFLGLFIPNGNGNLFKLRVETCVASPTASRDAATVQLVTGGCPAGGDVHTVVEENGASLQARIRVTSFLFQTSDFVYIFCDVQLCDNKTDCTKCNKARDGSSSSTGEVMIQLQYSDNVDYNGSVTYSALSWAVMCSTFLGFLSMKLY